MADVGLGPIQFANAIFGTTGVLEEGSIFQAALARLGSAIGSVANGGPINLKFGTGTATGIPGVSLSSQSSAAGIGNGADTTDDTLFTYALPANSLSANNKGIYVWAFGANGATGNNKTVKLKWGSQTLVTSGTITTNGGAWTVEAWITRTGVGTQQCIAYFYNGAAISVQTQTAGTQDETAAINLTLTGASPTSGAANDEVAFAMMVQTVN